MQGIGPKMQPLLVLVFQVKVVPKVVLVIWVVPKMLVIWVVPKVVLKLLLRVVLKLLLRVVHKHLLRHRAVPKVVVSSSSKKLHYTEKTSIEVFFLCSVVTFGVVKVKRLVTSFVVVVSDLKLQSCVEYRLYCLSHLVG